MNDKLLRQDVIDELDFDPGIDAAHIGVAAEQGVVTLTGHVPDYTQKLAAERAAWRVKGVKAIAEKIEVRFPDAKKLHDDEIAQRAINILAWSTTLPESALHVKVRDGWITLTGNVQWQYQRLAAAAAVRKLQGVTGITNSINLVPTVQPGDVKERILGALKRHAEVEASRIHVEVQPTGKVKIDGEVDNWEELRAIERAVWSMPGVRVLEDHVRIS